MTVERGVPDVGEVVSLLNDAYDIWGTEELFEWRYDECPDYDADEHTFHIMVDGEVAAFRRVTYKELVASDTTIPLFVLGDTAVDPERQGKGLYSQLHEETTNYCVENGASTVFTFNRKGNLTFKANKKRGWQYRELPLHIRILSPTEVIPNYAQLVIEDSKWLRRLIRLLGSRVTFKMSDGELALGELIDASQGSKRPNLSVHLSDFGVKRLVEVTSSDSGLWSVFTTGINLLLTGDISLWDRNDQSSLEMSESDLEIDRSNDPAFSDDEFDEIMELYDSFLSQYDLSFRREREDIQHMLSHPCLTEVVRVRGSGGLVGFATLGFHPGAELGELRVFDLIFENEIVFRTLIDHIEQAGWEYDAEIIGLFSSQNPGFLWSSVERQVIMWNHDPGVSNAAIDLEGSKWHFGFYDIA